MTVRRKRAAGDSFYSRIERLPSIDSTQRLVRDWMAVGVPEVAIAVADHQVAGRGRHGRTWEAPIGAALLLSAGFRPRPTLAPRHAWRIAATASLAMLDAAEATAGLKDDTLWLKWPNDIVAYTNAPEGAGPREGEIRKVAGVLAESSITAERIDWAVVGIGVNADWASADYPPQLASTMTSLRELAHGRPIDRQQLLDEFLARLEPRYEALRGGVFDAGGWSRRQVTTGQQVEVELGDELVRGVAAGVDPESGALLLESDGTHGAIESGEVVRCQVGRQLNRR